MTLLLAISVAALYTAGLYMLLRRSLAKLLIGLALLSHASNLLVFVAGGSTRSDPPPVIPEDGSSLLNFADPLPQALVLTAIVISFGFFAFAFTLLGRNAANMKTDDTDSLNNTEGTE